MNGVKLLSDMFADVPAPGDAVGRAGGRIAGECDLWITALKTLRGFIGGNQLHVVREMCRESEEKEFFQQKLIELAGAIQTMPKTRDQEEIEDPIVHLHYFVGACDWFILEKDVNPGQHQAFGWANLGDPQSAELGYISLPEITAHNAELDFHWEPKPLSQCKDNE